MKIGLYLGNNTGTRALAQRAANLMEVWPDAVIAHKVPDLKGCDVVFNQMVDQISKLEEQRRYVGFGPQVCLFAANVGEFGEKNTLRFLLDLDKVPVIVHSPYHLEEVRGVLRALTPAYQKNLLENLKYIPGGIHADFSTTGENDRNLWVVPYNRCNQLQKRMDDHIAISTKAKFLLRKQPIEHRYYLRDMEEVEGKNLDLSGYTVGVCPPTRAEYIAYARKTGMFLSTACFESFGMMYLELLLCGAVGVFVDYPWVRKLLPGYPLICSKTDAPGMMAAVHKDYDRVQAKIQAEWAPYIREHYSFTAFATSVRALLETTARGR